MGEFPVRLTRTDRVEIIILPRHMGGSAKIFLREIAKKIPEYHLPINLNCGISGRTDTGLEIPINNVGRWLFGTPGYMGHIRVSNWEGNEAKVEWPSQAPDVVHELVTKIKQKVEGTSSPRDILERAMHLIKKRRPGASLYKKAAFANSVQYIVTGWSGGFGGPSVREHAVGCLFAGRRLTFGEAVKLLLDKNGLIFGPIRKIHRMCWREEYCSDDDPRDVAELKSS